MPTKAAARLPLQQQHSRSIARTTAGAASAAKHSPWTPEHFKRQTRCQRRICSRASRRLEQHANKTEKRVLGVSMRACYSRTTAEDAVGGGDRFGGCGGC
jgi:hypothetical protein